jgi:hypothetical protein
MARINKSDVIQKAVNDLALSQSTDKIPNETLDKVQLTYDLNKKFSSFVSSNSRTTTGALTVTLPVIDARSEIFLTSLDFDYIKDATCDSATGAQGVQGTTAFSGILSNIALYNVVTLTAQNGHIHYDFAYPIKMVSNTTLTNSASFTVGVFLRSLSATGFISSTN